MTGGADRTPPDPFWAGWFLGSITGAVVAVGGMVLWLFAMRAGR